jgi:Uncharacterized protein conserved in bacteria C-term(DUF2220)
LRDAAVHYWGDPREDADISTPRWLNRGEADLHADLVADRLGDAVRLEQERLDWTWASDRLPYP